MMEDILEKYKGRIVLVDRGKGRVIDHGSSRRDFFEDDSIRNRDLKSRYRNSFQLNNQQIYSMGVLSEIDDEFLMLNPYRIFTSHAIDLGGFSKEYDENGETRIVGNFFKPYSELRKLKKRSPKRILVDPKQSSLIILQDSFFSEVRWGPSKKSIGGGYISRGERRYLNSEDFENL